MRVVEPLAEPGLYTRRRAGGEPVPALFANPARDESRLDPVTPEELEAWTGFKTLRVERSPEALLAAAAEQHHGRELTELLLWLILPLALAEWWFANRTLRQGTRLTESLAIDPVKKSPEPPRHDRRLDIRTQRPLPVAPAPAGRSRGIRGLHLPAPQPLARHPGLAAACAPAAFPAAALLGAAAARSPPGDHREDPAAPARAARYLGLDDPQPRPRLGRAALAQGAGVSRGRLDSPPGCPLPHRGLSLRHRPRYAAVAQRGCQARARWPGHRLNTAPDAFRALPRPGDSWRGRALRRPRHA